MAKYGNQKTVIDGIKFDSKAEAARYGELKLLETAGAIRNLRLQPRYELQPKFKRGGKTERAIVYVADFQYVEDGKVIAEDVKGVASQAFQIKRKLFLFKYPDIELRVTA